MADRLNESDFALLCSADEKGEIEIPCGSATEIEETLRALLCLENAGFVNRKEGSKHYRPFMLTEQGKIALKNQTCIAASSE
jgi:hypothetical protein